MIQKIHSLIRKFPVSVFSRAESRLCLAVTPIRQLCFVENVAFLKNNVKEEEEEEAKTERKNCDRNCLGGVHDCCCLRERAGELTASACSTPLCPNSPPLSYPQNTPFFKTPSKTPPVLSLLSRQRRSRTSVSRNTFYYHIRLLQFITFHF